MLTSQQAQNTSNIGKPSKNNLPSWTKFEICKLSYQILDCGGIIIGHYLVVIVQLARKRQLSPSKSERGEGAKVLAFNLKDHTVQEAAIDDIRLIDQDRHFSLLKYGENQIIKYSDEDSRVTPHDFVWITVESFEPFKVKCEEIKGCQEKFLNCSVQIYKDCLYVYGWKDSLFNKGSSKSGLSNSGSKSEEKSSLFGKGSSQSGLSRLGFNFEVKGSLFGKETSQPDEKSSLFGKETSQSGLSIFGSKSEEKSSLFGKDSSQKGLWSFGPKSDDKSSLFSKETSQSGLSIFGSKPEEKSSLFEKEPRQNELWSFNLTTRTWKLCETTGEGPELETGLFGGYRPGSFVFGDCLYIYGFLKNRDAVSDLFMLDFNSMNWTKIEQQEKYLEATEEKRRAKFSGAVYKGHLVTLAQPVGSPENRLCFLDLYSKNIWSTFDINGANLSDGFNGIGNLIIDKHMVWSLATPRSEDRCKELLLFTTNIRKLGIFASNSPEEHLHGLFLNESESDVAFKIEDRLIPAHKHVLMKKSRYFENLFNSGMAESKQDVIEINDCEYEIFKECFRFFYQERANLEHEEQAIKLYALADKYLQKDLLQECIDFLTSIIDRNNVYTILNFAHQENIPHIKQCCLKLLKDNLDFESITGLIEYLDRQDDQELQENNEDFRKLAFNFVLSNFSKIYEKSQENLQIYENHLIKCIEMKTVRDLAHFLTPRYGGGIEYQKRFKAMMEKSMSRLKEALFGFIQENIQTVMRGDIGERLSYEFIADFTLYLAAKIPKPVKSLEEEPFM